MEITDRMTMWRNWFEGVDLAPDDQRLAWYDATMRFCFRGVEPPPPSPEDPLSLIRWQAVCMIRASVEISRRQRLNGLKPKGSHSKAKAKPKGSLSKATREQVEVKVDEQHACAPHAREMVICDLKSRVRFVARTLGADDDFAEMFSAEMDKLQWQARGTRGDMFDVTPSNLTSVMRGWWIVESESRKKNFHAARGMDAAAIQTDGGGHPMTLEGIPDFK